MAGSRVLPARWRWLQELRDREVVRADLLAGLTGAIVVLPQGVAFAALAGMPIQYGLYSAMVPCVIAALFGSSRLMVTGPANAISLTVLALIAPLAVPESPDYVRLVLTLTFMVGVWQVLLGLVRAGRFVDLVPHSVIVGFTTGAAVLIVNSQFRNFLGLDWPRGMSVWASAQRLVADIANTHLPTLAVALLTLAACLVARPFNRHVPYMLVGVIAGGGMAALLQSVLGSTFVVKVVEALPGALPGLSAPDLSLDTLRVLFVPSLVMTLLALAEAVSIARAIAARNKQTLDGNQEVWAQGLANLAGSFFSSYPASGSFNRSGVNVEAGARTPLSAISAALLLIVLLAFVAPLSKYLPVPAVAAVLCMVAWGLIDRREIRHILANGPRDAWSMVVTFALTVSVSLEWAVLGGLTVWWLIGQVGRRMGWGPSGHR